MLERREGGREGVGRDIGWNGAGELVVIPAVDALVNR